MLAVVGTVPDRDFPLLHGEVCLEGDHLVLEGRRVAVNRGTPALAAAAQITAEHIGGQPIYAFLVGDIGHGDGSRRLYRFLTEHLNEYAFDVMTFHYLQPDVDWQNRVLFAMEAMSPRPLLIADAGFMYAAKMSGQAERYDFFTPDAGELAFLADEKAPHPFYTRGFILHQHDQVPELIAQAYRHHNAASHLLVKGKADHIVVRKEIIETIEEPSIEAMEAIGGTGDTLTGLLSSFCDAGRPPAEAASLAARANRWAGHFCNPTPATQIADLIHRMPQALREVMTLDGKDLFDPA